MAGNATLLYTVRNNYNIFRLALESAIAYIPKEQYANIVIVDDCSDEENILNYLNSLENDKSLNVTVVRGGKPKSLGYYNKTSRGKNPEQNTSLGHGIAISAGLEYVKTRYVLILDSDTNILPKGVNLIPNMLPCFDLDEKILAVGQSSGRIDGIVINHTGRFEYYKDKYNAETTGGFPNSCLILCDMKSWTEHGISTFGNAGWASAPYCYSLFKEGFKTCNYNVFKDGYALHLGYSTVRVTRENFTATLGFVKNCTKYGSLRGSDGSINDWYGGYFSVGLTTEELFNFLKVEYDGFPYDQRKSVIHKIISKSLGGEMDYEPGPKPCTNPLIKNFDPNNPPMPDSIRYKK